MLFRRIIYAAILVGFVSGLILSTIQIIGVNPIIFAAEAFESVEPKETVGVTLDVEAASQAQIKQVINTDDHHDHSHSHNHSHDGWAPEDGIERTGFTLFSNTAAGIGFAAILLALMSQFQLQGLTQLNVVKGMLWGLGGYCAFFLAPAIQMPPEIPGVQAAPLANRQGWWVFAVAGVGIGLLILAFAKRYYKLLGVIAIASPYLVGAPLHQGDVFIHPDPAVVQQLHQLHEQFIIASGLNNLVFWLSLGMLAAWVCKRWVLAGFTPPKSH